jgi:putative ABC transport system substrate-binding protein
MLNVELGGKRLEILKEVVPELSIVFLLWNPAHGNLLPRNNTEMIARAMSIRLQALEIRTEKDLETELAKLANARGSGLVVVEDPITVDHRMRLAEVAAKKSLPAIYGLSQHADAGGLLSYGIHLEDLFRRAATFIVNLKVATQIGLRLTVTPNVLIRANRVIR